MIEGKDISFCTGEGYEHLYQQSPSRLIWSRMSSDYLSTYGSYQFQDIDFDGRCTIKKLLPWESKLPSCAMNKHADRCFENGFEAEFISWLNSSNSDFSEQRFTRKDIQHWLDINKFPSKYQFEKQAISVTDFVTAKVDATIEKQLGTSEKNQLLKMILGMAIDSYRYDPVAKKNEATKQIVDDLAKLGISIDADTVRKYLKEAANTVTYTMLKT